MRGLQSHLDEFRAAGIQPVAISVDKPDVSRGLARKAGFAFPLLSDADASTIRRYGVPHQGVETEGKPMARPAEFLVDRTGTIRWRNLTGDYRVRARPEQMLEAARNALR